MDAPETAGRRPDSPYFRFIATALNTNRVRIRSTSRFSHQRESRMFAIQRRNRWIVEPEFAGRFSTSLSCILRKGIESRCWPSPGRTSLSEYRRGPRTHKARSQERSPKPESSVLLETHDVNDFWFAQYRLGQGAWVEKPASLAIR